MNDEPELELEAASAAVDGLATAEERALVESSPALRIDVERFTAIRDRMVDVVVPSAAREAAIAAALAAYDEVDDPAAAPVTRPVIRPTVVSLASRRRRQFTFLGAAAAVLAIVAVGVVAFGSRTDDDSDLASSFATTTPAIAVEAQPGDGVTETERTAETTAAEELDAATGAPEGAADQDAESSDTMAADGTAAELPAPASPTAGAPAETLAINEAGEITPSIASPIELRDYVIAAKAAADAADSTTADTESAPDTTTAVPAATDGPSSTAEAAETTAVVASELDPLQQCTTLQTAYVGTVSYQDVLAYVLEDVETGEITARSVADCTLLATVIP